MISEMRKQLLSAVEELWSIMPEYRFSQMISNYALLARTGKIEDIYDCEDDELLAAIRHQIDRLKGSEDNLLRAPSSVQPT